MSNKNSKFNNGWFIFSFSLLLTMAVVILFFWKKIPPQIPWFYSLPWGENQLMPKVGLLIVLITSLLALFFSLFLPSWTKKDDKIIEQTIMTSLLFILVMLAVGMIKVLLIFI